MTRTFRIARAGARRYPRRCPGPARRRPFSWPVPVDKRVDMLCKSSFRSH
jgi:hypothetical protein